MRLEASMINYLKTIFHKNHIDNLRSMGFKMSTEVNHHDKDGEKDPTPQIFIG